MTVRSPANFCRASAYDSSTDKLSGVVTRAEGKRFFCRAFTAAETSPVRRSTVHGSRSASTGARRFCSVSVANARSGVIHNTRSGSAFIVLPSKPADSIRGPSGCFRP